MCCFCFSAIGLLGVLFACLNNQSEQDLIASKVLFTSECRGKLLQMLLYSWMNTYIVYIDPILPADSAFPLFKPQVSESIIQKCQATHEGRWFIKFSKCIPYVIDLLEIVRAVIWSKDLACPIQSWLQQLQAIALPIGHSELLTGLVDWV